MEEILAKYFSGEASLDERTLVESWRAESETNANAFFDAKSVWLHSGKESTVNSSILDEIVKEEKEIKVVPLWSKVWFRVAVAASIVLVLSIVFIFNDQGESGYQNVSLSDGSQVALHGSSKLEVLNINEKIREVKVVGKAYFDIERDESRPFVIHTENAIVTVLGTSFVVDSYDAKTEVRVESGLVELLNTRKDVAIKLSKGEMGLVLNSNEGIIKKNNNDLNYLSWKTKVLTFKDASMEEVSDVLEDVYGVKVRFENVKFKSCKLTAKFSKKKPKEAIEIIARTFNIEYDYSDGVVVLKGNGC